MKCIGVQATARLGYPACNYLVAVYSRPSDASGCALGATGERYVLYIRTN